MTQPGSPCSFVYSLLQGLGRCHSPWVSSEFRFVHQLVIFFFSRCRASVFLYCLLLFCVKKYRPRVVEEGPCPHQHVGKMLCQEVFSGTSHVELMWPGTVQKEDACLHPCTPLFWSARLHVWVMMWYTFFGDWCLYCFFFLHGVTLDIHTRFQQGSRSGTCFL